MSISTNGASSRPPVTCAHDWWGFRSIDGIKIPILAAKSILRFCGVGSPAAGAAKPPNRCGKDQGTPRANPRAPHTANAKQRPPLCHGPCPCAAGVRAERMRIHQPKSHAGRGRCHPALGRWASGRCPATSRHREIRGIHAGAGEKAAGGEAGEGRRSRRFGTVRVGARCRALARSPGLNPISVAGPDDRNAQFHRITRKTNQRHRNAAGLEPVRMANRWASPRTPNCAASLSCCCQCSRHGMPH